MLQKFFALPFRLKIELVFYPFFLLYRMPVAWAKSLWEARILLQGRWSRYMGFHPENAINNLFYRTQWINFDRYGRSQNSPVVGLGDHALKNWFHLSLPASLIYANAGAVTTLVTTLVWVGSHLVWAGSAEIWWTVIIILTLLFSTTAYAMAFARQNYQMLGWMWLPLALFFTQTEQTISACLAWFAAGLFGITPIFFALPIVGSLAVWNDNAAILLVLMPALTYVAVRLSPLLETGGVKQTLSSMARTIGASKQNVRYLRNMQRISLKTTYFTVLYFFSALLVSFSLGELAILPILAAALFFVNQRFFRVADEESLMVITASLFSCTVIQAQPNLLTFLGFWLTLNPLAWLLSVQDLDHENGDGRILVRPPFDHTALEIGVTKFLAHVPPGSRIYFAFEDPEGRYDRIFDGYRVIHELPLQVASNKEVHLFPDWHAVVETNHEGAPQCWGRSLDEVIENCDRWGAGFAIIYQESGTDLDKRWAANFRCISEFDWAHYLYLFEGVRLWPTDKPTPKWFLLRRSA